MNPALTIWPPTLISGDMPNDLVPGSDGGLKATFTIAANSITDALLRDSAGLSVIGRAANSAGDPADITATTDHHVLRRSGTTIGWGPINIGQANATTGQLPVNKGGTGLSTLTSGSYLTGNGTAAVALRTVSQVWADIGPTARATAQAWSAAQTFSAGITANGVVNANAGVVGLVSGPTSVIVNLTGNPQNLNLNFNNNQVFELAANSAGTTNLTFTTANVSRVIYLGYIGVAAGRIVNWPAGVNVFAQGGSAETSFTVPAGVRGVIVLIQMTSTIFYRVT